MKSVIWILACLFCMETAIAQEVTFTVEVTTDTLYYGNALGLKYTITNAQGDFEPPSFEGFEIVGGPNVSSQFSMVNGDVFQSASYEYFLMPRETGALSLNEAILKNGNEELYSDAIVVVVVENPEGIVQQPNKYGLSKPSTFMLNRSNSNALPMTKEDSLKMKLKRIKARKI